MVLQSQAQITNPPLVSVLVPNYNYAHYIEETLHSIYAQTYSNIEVIVIDDGSQDNSVTLLKKLQQKWHFTLIEQANQGLVATANKGALTLAQGKYFCLIAADDAMQPSRIAKQVQQLEANPEYCLCHTAMITMNENSDLGELWPTSPACAIASYRDLFLGNAWINAPAVMLRLEALKSINGYLQQFWFEDLPTWLTLRKKYTFGYLSEPLTIYRQHSKNFSSQHDKITTEKEKILRYFAQQDNYSKKLFSYYSLIQFKYFSRHDKQRAKKYLPVAKKLWYRPLFLHALINYYWR